MCARAQKYLHPFTHTPKQTKSTLQHVSHTHSQTHTHPSEQKDALANTLKSKIQTKMHSMFGTSITTLQLSVCEHECGCGWDVFAPTRTSTNPPTYKHKRRGSLCRMQLQMRFLTRSPLRNKSTRHQMPKTQQRSTPRLLSIMLSWTRL